MKTRSQSDVLQRLPCLVAHLIAESLGYFTPEAAANAIAYYTKGEAFFCEWYYDWASKRNKTDMAAARCWRLANWRSRTPSVAGATIVAQWPSSSGPWPWSFT